MKKLLLTTFLLLGPVLGYLPSYSASSQPETLPLVLAIAGPVGDERAPSDPEVVSSVIELLRATNLVQVLPFSADLPAVRRAVLERRLDEQTIKLAAEPQKALRIGVAMASDYVVTIRGAVSGGKVSVSLQMLNVAKGDGWTASAEGQIPTGGGREDLNRSNTISTAASSAVSQIVISAFGQDAALGGRPAPPVEAPAPPPADDRPIVPKVEPEKPRDLDAEYQTALKQAEDYAAKNSLSSAVATLRRAIDLKPFDATARLALARLYLEMQMVAETLDECKRALLFDKDNVQIHEMLLKLYLDSGAVQEAAQQATEIIRLSPNNTHVRLTLGDLYWNQGQIEQAEASYKQATESSPQDAAPYERLQRLYVARKMYAKAFDHLVQARLRSSGDARDDSAHYRSLARSAEEEFRTIANKIQRAREDFTLNRITREEYYQECRDASNRADALAQVLSTQTVPKEFGEKHPHLVLAVSLLAQAAGYMVSYLETDKQHYSEQATLLQSEANTELRIFSDSIPLGQS